MWVLEARGRGTNAFSKAEIKHKRRQAFWHQPVHVQTSAARTTFCSSSSPRKLTSDETSRGAGGTAAHAGARGGVVPEDDAGTWHA